MFSLVMAVLSQAPAPQAWAAIDKLVEEQKFEAAATAVESRLQAAKSGGDDAELARALLKRTQLRIGLGGYETALKDLNAEAWPKALLPRTAVQLYWAFSLIRYLSAYSWEVRQRERVQATGAVDLKAWTADQIFAEAQNALEEVWKNREELGAQPVGALGEYLNINDYPKGVRDTLRDAVTYLRAQTLNNTQFWSAAEQNELFRVDFAALLKGDVAASAKLNLVDPAVHPLSKVGALFDDLESWHLKRSRREAALNARMERLRAIREHYATAAERAALSSELELRAGAAKDVPWSAAAWALLGEWLKDAGNWAKARQVAQQGQRAFPESFGGKQCAALVAMIEAPDFALSGMESDGLERRSLEISSRNMAKVHLRAYRVELESLRSRTEYSLLPSEQEIRTLIAGRAPVARWTVSLPATPDFKSHRTAVVPPLRDSGLYVVLASVREDFVDQANRILGQTFLVTKLVMGLRQSMADGSLEAVVVEGDTGEPASGVEVELWSLEYGKPRSRVETVRTDAAGSVKLMPKGRDGKNHFVVAHRGDDWALQRHNVYFSVPGRYEVNAAMIYTDRSVYRPQQKVFWKAIAYHGSADRSSFNTVPNAELTVSLLDANYQAVETRTLKTNGFGSAAGEFVIPSGRLLGNWSIAARGGNAYLRVEEYKRPTFEVAFKDAGAPMRLNTPATLKGEARYYFGLPVASGQVKWRVSRTPQYPWWWGWYGWSVPPVRTQVVGVGTGALRSDGSFELTFKPEADPKLSSEVTYHYEVEADVTDEGGETRSARKAVRLGNVAVEARVQLSAGFVSEGADASLEIRRTSLDGAGRAGKGSFRLMNIAQPARARLPADEPLVPAPGAPAAEFQTETDKLRPRWAPGWSASATLRSWADGPEQWRGEVEHDAKGEAKLSLPKLPAGAYRLRYETKDEFGAKFETATDFVVAGRAFPLKVPGHLAAEHSTVAVGGTARLLVGGIEGQALIFELYRDGRRVERRVLHSGRDPAVLELPVTEADRGGFSVSLQVVRDYQVLQFTENVFVPRDDRELKVEFATLRDTLRPGAQETFKVTVRGTGKKLEAGAAEVLAYMYDQSLDLFGPHSPPSPLSLFPGRTGVPYSQITLGAAQVHWIARNNWYTLPTSPQAQGDQLKFYEEYGMGGIGTFGRGRPVARRHRGALDDMGASAAFADEEKSVEKKEVSKKALLREEPASAPPPPPEPAPAVVDVARPASTERRPEDTAVQVRANFSETAFFKPNLVPDSTGAVSFEFKVPDSVTAWNVWAHAVTRDLRGGSTKGTTRSVKDLMVRPYLPRFLREGDQALVKVAVNNASVKDLNGELRLEIFDPDTQQSLLKEFAVTQSAPQPFTVKAGQGTSLSFSLVAPRRIGQVAFRVVAKSQEFSDGELRSVPVLPSRMHLVQSKFATLKDKDSRELTFDDLKRDDDPTRVNEQLVVTVDAQLFFTVLQALPYLVRYPYECNEQTMNRFLSAGIVSSVFRDHPAVAKMAAGFSKRQTPLETFDGLDPNRKIALEEAPWLQLAKGGKTSDETIDMLDPAVVSAERASALAKLKKAQLPNGAYPWFPGGPPSPYITLYLLHGFAKAAEFKVDVPRDLVQRAWAYVGAEFRGEVKACMARDACWEQVTFLNYVASAFPDDSWLGGALSAADRSQMLEFSFRHWKRHSPYLKATLALTLQRMKRDADAKLVFDSVMDSAKTTADEGTFWAPEDRAWLWYNDTIESHAFALRTLTELSPKDPRRAGLVQWLLLNKKLNQWKSTKATAEVIYALVKHLQAEGALGIREESNVEIGPVKQRYVFLPDEYTGKKNQLVVLGKDLDPKTMSTVRVSKSTKGFQFASATWHFSTDQMPKEARGDLFSVSRAYFKREKGGKEVTLKPLADGARIEVGDELEVQLSVRSRAPAEYVHVKDPRGAGFEPEGAVSKFKWNLGLGWYEEYRDSSTNFFFESVPVGEFTFKYRVRAAMAGTFRVGPAVMQSMYAPEFTAYSQGHVVPIGAAGK